MSLRVFAINPGSTSTKIALFEGETCLFSANVTHDASVLKTFAEIPDQFDYRMDTILSELAAHNIDLSTVDAFSARGGGLVLLEGGTYPINETLLQHARTCFTVKHPATLGAQIAHALAQKYGKPAFVVNPPDVDEFSDMARVTGLSGVFRESRIHTLNQKEIALRFAKSQGRAYEEMNLIVCHIGGGISVTAHQKGRMVDSNDIANGDGPFAPTRSGALPVNAVISMCFSGKWSEAEMHDFVTKTGGLVDHLGTSDAREVTARIRQGDRYAKLVYDAMIYQIAKCVGAMAVTLNGEVDGIIFTGGISHDAYLTGALEAQVRWIAPVTVMPGEFEMEALAAGAIRVLSGGEQPKEYTGVPIWDGFDDLKQKG